MSSSADFVAICTLLGYAVVAGAVIASRIVHWQAGWRLWLLSTMVSLYARLGFHWRTNRKCPFVEARQGIIIANHRGPVDPLLVWACMWNCRTVECMAAAEYFTIPGLAMFFRWLNAIPVARDGKDMVAMRTALRRLEEGKLVGVFPEGRINRGEGLLPGNPGIAFLALKSRAPVFPVYIENAPQGDGMVAQFWTFTRVKLHFGDAVDLSAYYERPRSAELLQEVTDLLMRRIGELGGLASPAPEVRPAQENVDEAISLPMVPRSVSA
jgi:1-acyl-sn-glycerol-3-phosphate acyltransferase